MKARDKQILVGGFEKKYNCTRVSKIKVSDIDWWENDALAHADLWNGEKFLGRKSLYFQFNSSLFSVIWDFNL